LYYYFPQFAPFGCVHCDIGAGAEVTAVDDSGFGGPNRGSL
jgi:hypothetical protein